MRAPNQSTRFANPPAPICRSETEQPAPPRINTKLLISIRNAEEAAVVRQAGVEWIDLKEPHAGSLGRPSLSEAVSVAESLKDHPHRSAALGELCELEDSIALEFAPFFPVLKVGLSRLDRSTGGAAGHATSWQARFQSLSAELLGRGAELIPVAYADWTTCNAPSLQDVLAFAQQIRASHILIDTFTKDGRGLLDWISLDGLNQVIQIARQFECGIVLAGSLKITNIPDLLNLQPAALAVRGAVCHPDSTSTQLHAPQVVQTRTTPIDPLKVELWRRSIGR